MTIVLKAVPVRVCLEEGGREGGREREREREREGGGIREVL